jgi:hypothetical protein
LKQPGHGALARTDATRYADHELHITAAADMRG